MRERNDRNPDGRHGRGSVGLYVNALKIFLIALNLLGFASDD